MIRYAFALLCWALLLLRVPALAQEQAPPQVNPTHVLQELQRLIEQSKQDPVVASRTRYISDQLHTLAAQEKQLQAWWGQTLQNLSQARVEDNGNRRWLSEVAVRYKEAKQCYSTEKEKIDRARRGFEAMQTAARGDLERKFPELTIIQPETRPSENPAADSELDRHELDALLTELEADFYRQSKSEGSPPVAESSTRKGSEGQQ